MTGESITNQQMEFIPKLKRHNDGIKLKAKAAANAILQRIPKQKLLQANYSAYAINHTMKTEAWWRVTNATVGTTILV